MPGYKEMMKLTGFRSKNAVWKLINRMVDEGVVSKDSSGRLIPDRLFGEVKVLGLVEAGIPLEAEESDIDSTSLDDLLIRHPDSTYMLRVKGDSMVEAGIFDGDMVMVDRLAEAGDGDIVIAEVDGGWTMKYLRKRGGRIYLEPANRRFKPIFPKEGLKVAAVVKAVIRKL